MKQLRRHLHAKRCHIPEMTGIVKTLEMTYQRMKRVLNRIATAEEWKRETGKRGKKVQDWKTRKKACTEIQTLYFTM